MKKIINDTESSIRERLDAFLLYIQEEKVLKGHIIASELEISTSMVDTFFKLSQLDDYYPERINKLEKVRDHSGLLSILSSEHYQEEFFEKILNQIDDIMKLDKPCEYILQLYLETQDQEYSSIDNLDPKYLFAIAKSLKERNINIRQLNIKLRGFMIIWGKILAKNEKIALGGKSSIVKAVIQDYEQGEGVFVNDDLQEKFPESVKIVEDLIKSTVVDKEVDVKTN